MDRKFQILKAIIESFIDSAEPIGSKHILDKMQLEISPATVRNDMASLERSGLVYQPYTSAGRIPTSQGFRIYVDELMGAPKEFVDTQRELALSTLREKVAEDRIHYGVNLLARSCANVSFATIPHQDKAYYLGLSNILQSPEFTRSMEAYTVIKIFEDQDRFLDVLKRLPIDNQIKVFIGAENLLEEIQSCSMIVTKFISPTMGEGVMGILGPTRMNYAYNMAALEQVRDHIENS